MIIGYGRVSTIDQSLDVQTDAIEKYAADHGEELKLFTEKQSGGKRDRQALKQAMDTARKGDIFVIYKLDRLARSTKDLLEITEELAQRGVQFVSINDSLDTTTAAGKAMFGMLAVFAEFERNIIRERTEAGLQAARRRGRTGGRPTLDKRMKQQIKALYDAKESATDIAKLLNVGRSTVYKVLKEFEETAGV
ncbi:recombinase family protein [Planococcus sp. FY231025]|uniref:recombinase family protein n=1 Tax=Planococcus sp. FY231025 TaxID=3455699 RepID=UPI003F9355AF